ncbi:LamG-like jellyroll fold domain-containing protein [Actinocorallia longicatena]|uniref:Laminin G domain-containing protein n=1 Tax=Actinocorallia longicatena TaxID=111803 RepID=A0ABP6Q739_9ACTN
MSLLRSSRRGLRKIALLTITALVMTVTADAALAVGALAVTPALRLPEAANVLGLFDTAPKPDWGSLPKQKSGTADGLPPEQGAPPPVKGGTGHKPKPGKGESPEYQRLVAKIAKGPSGANVGFEKRTSKRVASKSTATSDYFQNADGSFSRVVSPVPVNYQDGSGSWRPIDTELRNSADGRLTETANEFDVDFAASAADPELVRLGVDGHQISYSLQGAAPVAPTVSGSVATYPEALPHTDVQLEPTPVGMKESLVLKSADAASSWIFPLKADGLTLVQEPSGGIALQDRAGRTVTRIPAAYAVDSKLDPKSRLPATTHQVAYQLTKQGDQQALVMTLDKEWLHSADRVFPVIVDPATTLYSVSTYTISGGDYPAADRSTERILPVGSYDSGPHSTRSFLTFSNADALDNSHATVTSASLKIYAVYAATCTPQKFDVYRTSSPWKPWEVLTPATGPTNDPTIIGTLTPSVPNACANTGPTLNHNSVDELNVPLNANGVAAVNAWSQGTSPDYGLTLQATNSDTVHYKLFNSYNNWSTPPQLIVNYTGKILPRVEQQTPGDGYEAATLTPQFSATGRYDTAVTVANQKYRFQVIDSTGAQIADSGLVTAPNWSVPAGKLIWNRSYYWTVQTYDGTNYSPNPSLLTFSTPVPQPAITSSLAQNAGHGFNPAIGNYTHEATDAAVDTIGPDLAIARAYNSRDPRRNGAFGASWSTVLDSKAVEQLDGAGNVVSVNVTYPDGSVVGYGKNNAGGTGTDKTFTPPPGRFASLRMVTDGYTLTDKNETVYTFKQAGGANTWGITSITDANGRALNLTYTGGRVATMKSAVSGRTLFFDWSTPTAPNSAHVTKVSTDPVTAGSPTSALTWNYTYTGDQLSTVCHDGKCYAYAYKGGSPYHNQVLDLDPSSFWPMSETSGTTAVSAALANAHADDATYRNITLGQPDPLIGSSATSASFNGTNSSVWLRPTYKIGTAAPQTISLWFKTGTPNGVLFSYAHDDPGTQATSPSDYTPALYIGSNGKLQGEFWNNTDNSPMVSGAAVTDNKWHNVVLTSTGLKQRLYLDNVEIGNKDGLVQQPGQWTNVIGAGYLGSTWPNQPHYSTTDKTGYATFFNGLIADVAVFDRALTVPNVGNLFAMANQSASYLKTITLPSGKNHASVEYDNLTGTVTKVTDENGGAWTFDAPTVTGSSNVYRAAVLGGAPADYFRMSDLAGSPTARNEINAGTATYSNVTLGDTGPFTDSKAATFNGTSSFMELPAIDQLQTQPGSVEMWFKMQKGSTAGGVLYDQESDPLPGATQVSGSFVPALYVGTDGKLHGKLWDANGVNNGMISTDLVNDGQWHHAVLAAGTTGQAMYLDGDRVGTTSVPPIYAASNHTYIGAGMSGGNWPNHPTNVLGWFPGSISDVAFYRNQLSVQDVGQHYAAARQSNGPAPVQRVTFKDPAQNVLVNEYDLSNGGRQISATDALQHTTRFGYDSNGFERTVTDPNGNVTTTGHDVRGNVVSKTTCQNHAQNLCSTGYFTFLPDSTTTTLTPSPLNDLPKTERDGRSSGPADDTFLTVYDYDSAGNRTTVTSPPVPGFPGGRVTKTSYTDGTTIAAADTGFAPAGLPYKVVSPGGGTTLTSYFKNGDVASTTDAAGLVTRFTYDGVGRQLTMTEVSDTYPAGLTTTVAYDAAGNLNEKTSPPVTNRVTGAVHTAKTTTVFDADGNATSQTIADTTGGDASRTSSATYNSHNQVETETDELGFVTSSGYDLFGNKTSETDAEGRVTTTEYNANGQVTRKLLKNYTGDPNNPSPAQDLPLETRSYFNDGSPATVKDAVGNFTTYTYYNNGLTRTVTKTDPGNQGAFVESETFYDGAGNATKQVTNNGATTTTQAFDTAGRMYSSTLDPTGVARTTTVSYTPDDQVATTTEKDNGNTPITTSYTYDPMGRKTSESLAGDSSGHPVAWWKLNQTSGRQVSDSSGSGVTATASDGVTWADSAAAMNGTAGTQIAANGPVVDTSQSFTVSAWIKPTALNGNSQTLVSQDGVQQSGFMLQYAGYSNKWTFVRMGTDTANPANNFTLNATATPAAGTWTHLAGTFNAANGQMAIYVNGQQQGTLTNTTPWNATGPFVIGRGKWNGAQADFVNGSMDNVQAYNRVLSPTEVGTVFNGGRNGGTTASYDHSTTRWTLDKRGLPTAMTDANGNITDYTHDEAGRQVITTAPTVNAEIGGGAATPVRPTTTLGLDTFGEETETQDANGNITTTAYDAAGQKVTQTSPAYTAPGTSTVINAQQTWAYNKVGQITDATDPLNGVTHFAYDQQDFVSSVKDAKNGLSKSTYTRNGDVLSTTSPSGAQTQSTYDHLGRKLTDTTLERYPTAVASTTTYAYAGTPGGAFLASETTQAGVITKYGYNNAGEVTSTTDPANAITTISYDQRGRKSKVRQADGTATTTLYNLKDQPVKIADTDTDGVTELRSTTSAYDGTGAQLSATDARGHTSLFTNDALGRVTAETQPVDAANGITTSFGYDANGNRTRFTDGRGNAWTYGYNSWNQSETAVEPPTATYSSAADRTSTIGYDANGRVVKNTAPGGVVVTTGYDKLGAVTGKTGSGADAATVDRSFTYDGDGRMLTAGTSAIGTSVAATNETFTYNDRGNLLTATGSAGSSSFGYNIDDLLTTRTDAAGSTTYTYDTANRLKTIQDPASGSTLTYGYDAISQLKTIGYGTGSNSRAFGYDSLHRPTTDTLKTSAGTTIASVGYGYDGNDNITSKTTTGVSGASANTYTYDFADRMIGWTTGSTTTVYGYDDSGNRTRLGADVFTYDARNQLTSDGTGSTYTYTARGTLKTATKNSVTATYTSDAYGQQITEATYTGGTQTYLSDALGRNITATGGAGNNTFVYSGTENTLASDGTNTYTWDPADALTGIGTPNGSGGSTSTGVLAYTDQHQDVIANFKATTALTGSATYDPLGNIKSSTGLIGKLGYQSDWTDTTTGKVNMGARWYTPALGQFQNKDTLALDPVPTSIKANAFAYADDNPLTNLDPDGHAAQGGIAKGFGNTNTKAGGRGPAKSSTSSKKEQAKAKAKMMALQAKAKKAAAAAKKRERAKAEKAAAKAVSDGKRRSARVKSASSSSNKGKSNRGPGSPGDGPNVKQAIFDPLEKYREWVDERCPPATCGQVLNGLIELSKIVMDAIQGFVYEMYIVNVVGCFNGPNLTDCSLALLDVVPQGILEKLVFGVARLILKAERLRVFLKVFKARAGKSGEEATEAEKKLLKKEQQKICKTNSFSGSTLVLLADGSGKQISQVKVGDHIINTIPGSGASEINTVENVIITKDDHDFVDLKIGSLAEGRGPPKTGHITTTFHHPFYDATQAAFVDAMDLKEGDLLQQPDGTHATVLEVRLYQATISTYNLTVAGLHTFYVLAGSTPVLVHNQDLPCGVPGVGDLPSKVVNSNMGHVDLTRAERAGFTTIRGARDAVRDLGKQIEKSGFPEGTISDTAHADRVLVPIGEKGYAVYQIKPNGNAVFKTILERR